jgi:hypothetical protein
MVYRAYYSQRSSDLRSRFLIGLTVGFLFLGHGTGRADAIIDPPPTDRQKGVGIGAALISGGGAILVGLGTFGFGGVLFGAAAGGFQVGTGAAIVAKSVSSATIPDANFQQAVQVATLTINQLPDSTLVDPSLANPANAAMQDLGTFDANIRAFGIARNRFASALAAGDAAAAQSQLIAASGFFTIAQGGLFRFSSDLSQIDSALVANPIGAVTFDVASLFSSVQSTLVSTGFPSAEQAFISQYQMSSNEQNLFISTVAGLTSSDAVGVYGNSITFQRLIGQIGTLSGDIATNLSAETNFSPVPEPSTLVMEGIGTMIIVGYWRRRRRSPSKGAAADGRLTSGLGE